MSIATEIQRLQNAKASIKTSIENKGVVVSSSDTLDDYAGYIDAINISTQEKTITPQNQTHEITADSGYRGLSKVILDGVLVDAHDSYTTSTDSTTAYTKTVPSGALKYANLDRLGGISYKCENLKDLSYPTINYYRNNNSAFFDTTDSNTSRIRTESFEFEPIANKTYYVNSIPTNINLIAVRCYDSSKNIINNASSVSGNSFTITVSNVKYIHLLFGGSNFDDNTKTLFNQIGIFSEPYFEVIKDSAVTSVVSKDSNDTTIGTFNIPSEVQALEGYGWGVNDTCYNYIDYEAKKFIQKVGRVDLGSLNWALSGTGDNARFITLGISSLVLKGTTNLLCTKYTAIRWDNLVSSNDDMVIATRTSDGYLGIRNLSYADATAFKTAMSGVYLYYELATPVETDISAYIDDNFIEVEAGGSITANNTYNQAVPSEITYLVEV